MKDYKHQVAGRWEAVLGKNRFQVDESHVSCCPDCQVERWPMSAHRMADRAADLLSEHRDLLRRLASEVVVSCSTGPPIEWRRDASGLWRLCFNKSRLDLDRGTLVPSVVFGSLAQRAWCDLAPVQIGRELFDDLFLAVAGRDTGWLRRLPVADGLAQQVQGWLSP